RVALGRRGPAPGLPTAVRRAVRHGGRPIAADLLRGQLHGRGAGGGGARVAHRLGPRVRSVLPPGRQTHPHRRPCEPAAARYSRYRRGGPRLALLAHGGGPEPAAARAAAPALVFSLLARAGAGARWALAPPAGAAPGDVRLAQGADTGPRPALRQTARQAERLARPLLPGERVDLDRADVIEITRLPRVGPA